MRRRADRSAEHAAARLAAMLLLLSCLGASTSTGAPLHVTPREGCVVVSGVSKQCTYRATGPGSYTAAGTGWYIAISSGGDWKKVADDYATSCSVPTTDWIYRGAIASRPGDLVLLKIADRCEGFVRGENDEAADGPTSDSGWYPSSGPPPDIVVETEYRETYLPTETVPMMTGYATAGATVRAVEVRSYDPSGAAVSLDVDCPACGTGAEHVTWSARPPDEPGYWAIRAVAVDSWNRESLYEEVGYLRLGATVPSDE